MNLQERAKHRLVTPVVYALIFPVTAYLAYAVTPLVYTVTYYTLSVSPDSGILFYGVPLIVFCFVYGVSGWLLLVVERLSKPGFRDHLRRACLLYVGALLGLSAMVVFPYMEGLDKGYVIFPLGGLFCAIAIVIDAVLLTLARLRSHISIERTDARSLT